jgi:hypothetical protein
MATALRSVIENTGMVVDIQGTEYVKVEGWTTMIGMLGITPIEVSNVLNEDEDGYRYYVATVALINGAGREVVRATSECGSEGDGPWPNRAMYAKRSMATTRATGKACRLAFSWIISLAGYKTTPAEEMPYGDAPPAVPARRAPAAPREAPKEAPKKARRARKPKGEPAAPPGPGTAGLTNHQLRIMTCPQCGAVGALIVGQEQYGGGYVCWKRSPNTEGCGAKYRDRNELLGVEDGPGMTVEDIKPEPKEEEAKLPDPVEPPPGLFEK